MADLFPTAPCSQGSAASTADSTEPGCAPPSSASPSRGDARSSPPDFPECQSSQTYVRSHVRNETADADRWKPSDTALTLAKGTLNGIPGHTLAVTAIEAVGRKMSGGPEVGLGIREGGPMFTLDKESHHAVALTYSPAASPAKTCPSPDGAQDSAASGPPCSSNSPESQTSLFAPADSFWSKTSRVFLVPEADGTSRPSSGRWPTSGFMTSPGEFSIPGSLEFPSGGGVSSSLRDVLEESVAPKYFLSPKAAAGILRRASRRGKKLPEHLEAALATVAGRLTPKE